MKRTLICCVFITGSLAAQPVLVRSGAQKHHLKHEKLAEYTLPTMVFENSRAKIKDSVVTRAQTGRQGMLVYHYSSSARQQSASSSLSESLENLSGLQVYSQVGVNPLFYLRGQKASITVNGVPLNAFDSDAQTLNLIPFNDIAEVTISPCGNSVANGDMGIGGHVNIVTRDRIHNVIRISPGYPGLGNESVSWGRTLTPHWTLLLNQYGQDQKGYRDFSRNISHALSLKLIHHTAVDHTRFFINHAFQNLQFPGALTLEQAESNPWQASSSLYGKQAYHSQTLWVGVTNRHTLSQQVTSKILLTYQRLWAYNRYPLVQSDFTSEYYSHLHFKPSLTVSGHLFQHGLTTHLGLDVGHQTFSDSATSIQSSQQNMFAFFVMPELKWSQSWDTGFGYRLAFVDTRGHIVAGQAASSHHSTVYAANAYLSHHWSQHVASRIRVSRDFQLPFIDQSNYTPQAESGFGLKPETAVSYSISQSLTYKTWSVGANLYVMNIRNQVAFDPSVKCSSGPDGANVNLPPSRQYGLVVNAQADLEPEWSLGSSLTVAKNEFVSGRYDDTSLRGDQVPGVPEWLAELHANYHLASGFHVYLQGLYRGAMYADGDFLNTTKAAGHLIMNMAVGYQVHQWRFNLRLNNLFNKRYNTYSSYNTYSGLSVYPADGINGQFSIAYVFK